MKKKHILLITVGILFILVGAFHKNIWFDEAYTVGMINRSFTEIWNITGNDVHPALYYWMLKLVSLVFGNSIIVYRLFSVVAVAIMGILGYTHIRKDFGEKTGLIFSFLALFLPAMTTYATEIRMYAWAMLFVTVTAIYTYRVVKENSIKNWIIFAVFSLASAYTHYYALMAVGLINAFLGIYILTNKKEEKRYLISFIIAGVIQVLAYLPWLVNFTSQLKQVSGGFWIGFSFPDTIIDIFSVQYLVDFGGNILKYSIFVLTILFYVYIGYIAKKEKSERKDEKVKSPLQALAVYILVIVAALIITIKTPILYHRYLITITGLLIFFLAYFMSKEKNKYVTIGICAVILILSSANNISNSIENYDQDNLKQVEYLKENIQKDDIIIYSDMIGSGHLFAVNFPNNRQYFYNPEDWGVEEAYKAFGDHLSVEISKRFLTRCNGRVWLVDSRENGIYDEMFRETVGVELISEEKFETKYQNRTYTVVLIENNR